MLRHGVALDLGAALIVPSGVLRACRRLELA
jgi:hypothetical protein